MTSKALAVLVVASVLAGASGCSDGLGVRTSDNSVGVIVSAPVPVRLPPGAVARGARAAASSASGTSVVYVSLPPSAVPRGIWATITNQATAQYVTTPVVDGGFDPVPLAASIADTLAIDITGAAAAALAHVRLAVSSARPLKVVRTSPPSGGRDVPLNATIVVVFSEPITPTTVDTATVGLTTGTTRVRGKVDLSLDGLRVFFAPDSLLVPNQMYVLSLTTGITSAAGLALAAPVQSSFTTAAPTPTLSVMIVYGGINLTVDSGGRLQLHAVGRDVSGSVVQDVSATYVPLHPASDLKTSVTPTGLVTAIAPGIDTIMASAGGISMPVAVTVLPHGTLDPFAVSTWDFVQQSSIMGCESGSVIYSDTPGLVWPFKGMELHVMRGCNGYVWSPNGFGLSGQGGLGATALLPSGQFGDTGTVTMGDSSCLWSGVYRGGANPQISGTMRAVVVGSNSCLDTATWWAIPATPVVAMALPTPHLTCSVGRSVVDSVALLDALGHQVHRFALPTTSDDPAVAELNVGYYAGTDTTVVVNGGDMFMGYLVIRCNATGQTQLHITQDLATATIAVTVTP